MVAKQGAESAAPVTKIGGAPWWPKGTPRPVCHESNHMMEFVAQILLSDVPGFEHLRDHLYSFHYCRECMSAGRTSYGWMPVDESPQPIPFPSIGQRLVSLFGIAPIPNIAPWLDSRSYNTTIFTHTNEIEPDALGCPADTLIVPKAFDFESMNEVPLPDDYPEGLCDPRDHTSFVDLPETGFEIGNLLHCHSSKLGGWPTWLQNAHYPTGIRDSRMRLVAQLDHKLVEHSAWGGGGFAYLFADLSSVYSPSAQLVVQTT